MNYLIFGLVVLALVLGPVGIIAFIVDLVKHKSKKNPLIILSLSIICLVVSVALSVTTDTGSTSTNVGSTPTYSNNNATTQNSNTMTDTELFAAKFCMAYMNHLKNPYSFTVHSVWAYNEGGGKYQTFVKFTADNGYGASVADQIGTMGSLSYSDLNQLASSADYVNIYTWGSEPAYKMVGKGENLDANKIQNYINNNYN